MKPNAELFGKCSPEWIEDCIGRAGITRKEAAERVGITERMLYYYLTGRHPIPYTVQYTVEGLCEMGQSD